MIALLLCILQFCAQATIYAYDGANNRTQAAITGGTTTNYVVNNLNQTTSSSDGTCTETWTFDANGNAIQCVVTGGSYPGTDTYSYDYENRLVGLVKGSGATGTGTYAYQYDYRTRRITRDESGAGGVFTSIVFSGGTSVQEYAGTTPVLTVEYIRGSDYGGGVGGILYTLRGGVPSYTHANRRGDVVAKTDSTGMLTFQNQYDAFGKQIATTGATLDRQKSNSKETDPTGLVDEGKRYRHGDLFLTRDPAGFVDGPNEYCYVIQNPWTKFDPEGLQGILDVPEENLGTKIVAAGKFVGREGEAAGEAIGYYGYEEVEAAPAQEAAVVKVLDEITPPVNVPPLVDSQQAKALANNTVTVSGGGEITIEAPKPAESLPPGGESAQNIHGNSLDSTKPQHTYDIIDTDTGKLHKTGISGQPLNKDGSSPRANGQVNTLNNAAGYDKYKATVTGTNIPGRRAALQQEQQRVDDYAAQDPNRQGPPGNQKPQPTPSTGPPSPPPPPPTTPPPKGT